MWVELSGVAVAAGAVVVSAFGVASRSTRAVKALHAEVELTKAMPEGEARSLLEERIERRGRLLVVKLDRRDQSWMDRADDGLGLALLGSVLLLIGGLLEQLDGVVPIVVGAALALLGLGFIVWLFGIMVVALCLEILGVSRGINRWLDERTQRAVKRRVARRAGERRSTDE